MFEFCFYWAVPASYKMFDKYLTYAHRQLKNELLF